MLDVADDAELAERLAARTLELVDVPSESRDEAALAAHVLRILDLGGVAVRDAGDGCVVAECGAAEGPLIVLAGHLDTVPAQGNRPGRRDAEAVHGLGATDMKAALAVMIETGLLLRDAGKRVALCFFGREELGIVDSALTPLLARDAHLPGAELALVMEPTDNALQGGCLGNVNATWTFTGRSGHSARPWLADNAITHAAAGIAALHAVPVERMRFDGLEFAEVASVTRIAGGIAENVIPDAVTCHVNYRYGPGRSAADAEARIRALCDQPHATLEIHSNAPSGAVAVGHPLVQELIAAGGLPVGPKQAWTPVAEFALAGVPAVNFGPGDPAYAHRRDELVRVDALVKSARTLEAFLCSS
ncbi:MAG: succinyl-diaminopimelate desuccinylase [Actinomycetota bacterium]|nr:succinyl-diaminopimelate desuccinylase [Actinomycetota bacterium]